MSDDQVFLDELEDADTLSERRTDVAYAREVIEKLLPEEGLRRQFLTFMADCIELAHDHAPGAWEITLKKSEFSMNFGLYRILMIKSNIIEFIIPDTLESSEEEKSWWREVLEKGSASEPFKTIASARLYQFSFESFLTMFPKLLPFLLRQYGNIFPVIWKSSGSSPYKQAHSVGVLLYMRDYLDRDLPDPTYSKINIDESNELEAWRAQETSARDVIEKLLPDAAIRDQFLGFMAECIDLAHHCAKASWSIVLHDNGLTLNIGLGYVAIIKANKLGMLVIDNPELSGDSLAFWNDVIEKGELGEPYKRFPQARLLWISSDIFVGSATAFLPLLLTQYKSIIEEWCAWGSISTWRSSHSPGVLSYMRRVLDRELPSPVFPETTVEQEDSWNLLACLQEGTASRNLHYTDEQLAAYFTALQTKGFVILSGISGTGKTKLAQTLADMLPQSVITVVDDSLPSVVIRPSMLTNKQIDLPLGFLERFPFLQMEEKKRFPTHCGEYSTPCLLSHYVYPNSSSLCLNLSEDCALGFKDAFRAGDKAYLDFTIDDGGELKEITILTEKEATLRSSGHAEEIPNSLFESVRTDWRDSKSLLGYYNPLTGTYMWTDFLRFVLRATESYKRGEKTAWFVILDEMNLARVEYYFSDLLSVLESGRSQDGFTKEPLRLNLPLDARGDLPPQELYLPPNFYIVGTVNVDETTYSFSPKVLDRAFTLELNDVDFASYVPSAATEGTLERSEALLNILVGDNKFQHNSKQQVAECLERIPWLRERLLALNVTLQPHKMHVGYRIFDEIACYVQTAHGSGIYDSLGGDQAAFDQAVLMKVLPRFHGSRQALEVPLSALLQWCAGDGRQPENPLSTPDPLKAIEGMQIEEWFSPRTAHRVLGLMRELVLDGFAAFG